MSKGSSISSLYKDWLLVVTLGEFVGFIIPSVAGVLTVYLQVSQFTQMVILVLAGMGEGVVLGYAQSRVLLRIIPRMNPYHWIFSTLLGAGIAWFIGLLPSTFLSDGQIPSLFLIIPLGIFLIIIFLLSIGYLQYRLLRQFVPHAQRWIWGNVIAWVSGLAALFTFMSIAPDGFIATLLFSILGGLAMAATMAAITGRFVVRIKL